MPCSSIRWRRAAGSRKAGIDLMGFPKISRRLFPSGLPIRKYSSWAPGRATTSNVGLGMYSLIWPRMTIFVRPWTST